MQLNQVVGLLVQRLREGRYLTDDRLAPIRVLASDIDASYVTVQKAIKILAEQEVLSVRPGKGVFLKRLVDKPPLTETGEHLLYIAASSSLKEYEFELYCTFQRIVRSRGYVDRLIKDQEILDNPHERERIVGAVVSQVCPLARNLKDAGIPVVYCTLVPTDSSISSVNPDFYTGCRIATQYLYEMGHRQLAFAFPYQAMDEVLPTFALRQRGFHEAVQDLGLPPQPEFRWNYLYAVEEARKLLTSPERPTAILAANDVMAVEIINLARSLDLRVPQSLSVIGLENMAASRECTPALTTVRYDMEFLAVETTNLLLTLIDNSASMATHKLLPMELVKRDTVIRR